MSHPFIKIMLPCQQNWNEMQPYLNGRMCSHCNKQVLDFASFTKEEILNFLKGSANEKVCGRFRKEHVNSGNVMPTVEIFPIEPLKSTVVSRTFMLAVGVMLLTGSAHASTCTQHINHSTFLSVHYYNSFQRNQLKTDDTLKIKPDRPVLLTEPDTHDILVTGEPDYVSSDIFLPDINILSEPHFKGGHAKLLEFLSQNIKYPEWEEKHNIRGVVYVSFIVDNNGRIVQPKVVRSVEGSRNFDNEVLRVINLMPDWIPATDKKGNVSREVVIPVSFRLKY